MASVGVVDAVGPDEAGVVDIVESEEFPPPHETKTALTRVRKPNLQIKTKCLYIFILKPNI